MNSAGALSTASLAGVGKVGNARFLLKREIAAPRQSLVGTLPPTRFPCASEHCLVRWWTSMNFSLAN